ncbi:hypothetical protein F8M41_007917 [Gigaspora margarita]|uniref:Uncharacterized protein n=1 Tax=Gigaspora margarita TaxID=4874 RepID=A0A8H3X525_GIGMA|nr:hypothetical protein F8M41_007917 [Gigaspora margarita]
MLLCFYKLIVPIFVELECSLDSVIQIACLFSHLSFDVPTRRMGVSLRHIFYSKFMSVTKGKRFKKSPPGHPRTWHHPKDIYL